MFIQHGPEVSAILCIWGSAVDTAICSNTGGETGRTGLAKRFSRPVLFLRCPRKILIFSINAETVFFCRWSHDSLPFLLQVFAQMTPYQRVCVDNYFEIIIPALATSFSYAFFLGNLLKSTFYYLPHPYIFTCEFLCVFFPLLEYKLPETRHLFCLFCLLYIPGT